MKLFVTILSVLSASYTAVHSFPQQSAVSADELIKAADSSRYGSDPVAQAQTDALSDASLSDVFSSNSANDFLDGALNPDTNGDDTDVPPDVIEDVFGPGSSSNTKGPKTFIDTKNQACTGYAEFGFECVPYYQCEDGFIITDGAGLFDIRSALLDPTVSKCPSDLEVCCRDESFIDVPLPPLEQPLPPPTTTTPEPTTTTPVPKVPTPKPIAQTKCGQRNTNGVGVRIQSQEGKTQFGEWPHMCAVLRKQQLGGKDVNLYVCGGSLIAKNVILTAAHCVDEFVNNPEVIKVRCGEWDTQQTIEPEIHEDRISSKITLHPLFSPTSLANDVALIHLEEEFELKPHINTICLPDQDSEYNSDFSDKDCVATGWGKDKYGRDGQYQVIMKQVEMDLVERQECQADLRTTKLGRRFRLDESFLCAGGEPNEDTCKGDGGGPLVCPRYTNNGNQQQYVQAGIIALGIECGTEIPGVYANVSKALCFIDWATKCTDGPEADYYGYEGCIGWAKREYCQYKDELEQLRAQDNLPSARRKARKVEASVKKLEAAMKSCNSSPYFNSEEEIDCNDYNDYEVDLGDFARKEVTNVNPRTANE